MTRADHPREGERGKVAGRLRGALRGKDRTGDDQSPAIRAENAGFNRREEIALDNENGRPFGLNIAGHAVHDRAAGDPDSPVRDEYLKRH